MLLPESHVLHLTDALTRKQHFSPCLELGSNLCLCRISEGTSYTAGYSFASVSPIIRDHERGNSYVHVSSEYI
jgi:hypothetical protein